MAEVVEVLEVGYHPSRKNPKLWLKFTSETLVSNCFSIILAVVAPWVDFNNIPIESAVFP